jgi:hypothetical protein
VKIIGLHGGFYSEPYLVLFGIIRRGLEPLKSQVLAMRSNHWPAHGVVIVVAYIQKHMEELPSV